MVMTWRRYNVIYESVFVEVCNALLQQCALRDGYHIGRDGHELEGVLRGWSHYARCWDLPCVLGLKCSVPGVEETLPCGDARMADSHYSSDTAAPGT